MTARSITSKFAIAVATNVALFYQEHGHDTKAGIDQKVKAFLKAESSEEKTGTLFELIALATDLELKGLIVGNQQIPLNSEKCLQIQRFVGHIAEHPDTQVDDLSKALQQATL